MLLLIISTSWYNFRKRPINTSKQYRFKEKIKINILGKKKTLNIIGHFKTWDTEMKTDFIEICGKLMQELGYHI